MESFSKAAVKPASVGTATGSSAISGSLRVSAASGDVTVLAIDSGSTDDLREILILRLEE